jgi:poly(A) polymerase
MKIRAYGLFLCLLAALALISGSALGEAPGLSVLPEADPAERAGLFASAEVNAMIDENYEAVVRDGWAELRIPMSMHGFTEEHFPANSLDAAHKLIDAGYDAYMIGGSVRDLIMGTETMDYDITTNASNEAIVEVLGDVTFHSIATGHEFAIVHYGDEIVDVATCINIPASYHGIPGVPEFDPESLYSDNFVADSFQRDLTMNAIYYDVATGDLVDFHGGLHDIREGILDTMLDAKVELVTDPRVAVRAMRFKARYGARFSDRLETEMRERAPEYVTNCAPKANLVNLRKFYTAGYARDAWDTLMDYGAFPALYTPVADLCHSPDYQSYIRSAMEWMDTWHDAGNLQDSDLAMAAILWPAVADLDAEGIAEVLEAQSKTIMLFEDIRQKYMALFELEKSLTGSFTDEEAMEMVFQSQFENAYELLLMRGETDKSLEDAIAFWTGARSFTMSDAEAVIAA